MEVVAHPYLEGVLCREDGAVFVPKNGVHKAHWTFGHRMANGYFRVRCSYKDILVHRLICEAFHGQGPEGCEVDHINRDKGDNRPENLRWCSKSENNRNKKVCDEALAKYGVSSAEDRAAYMHAWYVKKKGKEK